MCTSEHDWGDSTLCVCLAGGGGGGVSCGDTR